MHRKEKDSCMLCFSIFIYFTILYVSFFSISQFLFIIIYLLLSMLTVYNGTKLLRCVSCMPWYNFITDTLYIDLILLPLSMVFIYPTSFCFCTKLHNQYVVGLDQKIISVSTDEKIFLPLVYCYIIPVDLVVFIPFNSRCNQDMQYYYMGLD